MAVSAIITLDDNPTAIAGKGNPNGIQNQGLRFLRRKVTFGDTTGTITAPFRISHIEGLGAAGQVVTNTQFGGSVAVTGTTAATYYITIVCTT